MPHDARKTGRAARVRRSGWLATLAAVLAACSTTVTSAGSPGPEEQALLGSRDAATVTDDAELDRTPGVVLGVPRSIAMIGDSITVASETALRAELRAVGVDEVIIDAQVGRRMTVGERGRTIPGTRAVEGLIESAPELWVIALGTNDIGQYADADLIADHVAALLALIPAGVPVVWVDTWFRDRPDETALVNEAIREVVEARPGSLVVDWYVHAAADGIIAADGVHLTVERGTEAFARTVVAALEDLWSER